LTVCFSASNATARSRAGPSLATSLAKEMSSSSACNVSVSVGTNTSRSTDAVPAKVSRSASGTMSIR